MTPSDKIPLLDQLRAKAKAATASALEDYTDEDGSAICAICLDLVSVHDGCDFEPGDICDSCAQEWFKDANPEIMLKLLDMIEDLQASLRFKSERNCYHINELDKAKEQAGVWLSATAEARLRIKKLEDALDVMGEALVYVHGQPFNGSWDAQAVYLNGVFHRAKEVLK